MRLPTSVDEVCEVTVHGSPSAKKWLLIEVPHGATERSHYDQVASRLKSRLPAQLEHFFFVNTDIGAPEGAEWLGRELAKMSIGVVVARCLLPRTFIDTNRVVAASNGGLVAKGLTPAVPGYVTHEDDVTWLIERHAQYHAVVNELYVQVCASAQGLALQLHSYAPRSVGIEKTDSNIVEALHAAYQPETYATWPERPVIDLISQTEDGAFHTAPRLVGELLKSFAAHGIDAKENATYHLHPITMGYVYAKQYEGRVVCVEMNRGTIAAPFTPFGVSPLSEENIGRVMRPVAEVLRSELRP